MKRTLCVSLVSLVVFLALILILGSDPHATVSAWADRVSFPRRGSPCSVILVTSTGDSGPGMLRWARFDAGPGDTVAFDPGVFLAGSPATISVTGGRLSGLIQDSLVLSGVRAGMIVDGSDLPDTNAVSGIEVVETLSVTVEGLTMNGFAGAGIVLALRQRNPAPAVLPVWLASKRVQQAA